MAHKVYGCLLLAAAMLAPTTGGLAKPDSVAAVNAIYDLHMGGIWAGEMTVNADFGVEAYRADLKARTVGLLGFFVDAEVQAQSVGKVGASGLTPQRFTAKMREDKDNQFVEIAYQGGSEPSVRAEPAYKDRPWSLAPNDQPGFLDPLSAGFAAFMPTPRDAVCSQPVDVFDGEHRWAIEMGALTQEGDKLRCEAVYVRVAGFKPKKMGDRARWPFSLYYEERDDGMFHVVRAVGETDYGVAVVRLRK